MKPNHRSGIASLLIVAVLAVTIGSAASPASAATTAKPGHSSPVAITDAASSDARSEPPAKGASDSHVSVHAAACVVDEYEPNDTIATATPLAKATLINANACANNLDYFTFSAAADGNLVADMQFSSAVGDLDLELLDSTGAILATSYFGTDVEHVEYEVEGGTNYMLRVYGFDGPEGPYTLRYDIEHCPPDDQYEPNDTPEAATPIAEDTLIDAVGCTATEDFFGFTAGSTGTVVIDLGFLATDGDIDLGLYDSGDVLLAASQGTSNNEHIEYPVEAGQTYTIQVLHFEGGEVPYTLVYDIPHCPPDDQYEPNDTPAEATPLAEKTEVGARICQDNDDYFAFTAQSTGNVVIDLGYSAAEGDLDLRLLNSSGELLAVSSGVDDDEHIEFSVVEDADYVLQVDGFEAAEGSYTLLFDIPHCPPDDQYEPNDTLEQATPLGEDTSIDARMCEGNENDFFGFTAASTGNVVIDLGFSATNGGIDLGLLDSTGFTVATSADTDDDEQILFPVEEGTSYTIWVNRFEGEDVPYTLIYDIQHCPPDDQYEPNDVRDQLTNPAITEDTLLSAQLCPGNVDVFQLVPTSNGQLSVDLSWSDDTADLTLTLYSVFGDVLEVGETTGTSAHLEHLVNPHGTHFVEVSGGETPYTISYDLGSCPPDPFEPNDTLLTAAALTVDTPIEGTICPDDDDFYALTVESRTTLVVDVTNSVTELNVFLNLRDGSGETIAFVDAIADNERLEHVIDVPGTYYLQVGEFVNNNAGVYGLTWTTSPASPGAPTGVTGVAGSTQVDVSWTAPADGGSPITGYTVTTSPGGATCTTTDATSCAVTGLTNGTAYTFTVTATNAIGTGDPSAPSAPVTPTDCGDSGPGPFPDVPGDHPFCTDIEWLALGGVTGGFPDGTFRPGINITRQAMAAFIYRYSGEPAFTPPATPTFSDVPISHPFFKEIEWLASTAITGGFADGTFRPGASITRQAAAAFFYRLAGEPPFTPPATPTFPDVPASHPFFKEIEWLSTTGITGGFADGTYRPGGAVTRQAFAAFLHRYDDL